ncbi:hypothetical protein [Desulfonema magnum]|uniref:HD domain-containing protein n=1 Tax=Desulfonema magnum TaxID=45655 RepID=A0A975BV21_9BACT|nr:hypothetical protein [Desulfonema magnum]QTA92027.1 HD domain-containing protein [Desulfonema magnum]
MDGIINDIQLSNLVNADFPEAVLEEVQITLNLISPQFNSVPVVSAFLTVVELYKGNYPGYKACNTDYHDLRHTMNVFLTMTRLFHGATLDGKTFTDREITISLIAALFHDVGYIQEEWDKQGTGGKHTFTYVRRGADFLKRYGQKHGLSDEEIDMGRCMIFCTKIASNIPSVRSGCTRAEFLGKMLCTADLLAQMSDRIYLEKLLFLYHEIKECNLASTFENEVDLLRKTINFYEFTAEYIKAILDENDRFLRLHFASRWDIQRNLYQEAIDRQKNYLKQILEIPGSDPRKHLKRHGIVDKVREKYGKDDHGL